VYNRLEGQYMLFIPNADTVAETTETVCYVVTYNRKKQIKAWHRFRGWNFRCGTRDENDELFFYNGTKLYRYGSKFNTVSADFVGDPAVGSEGTDIAFDWELPWLDIGTRSRYKNLKYIKIGSYGTASFDVQLYCDYQQLDMNNQPTPQLVLPMVGGGTPGFGGGAQPYGTGRTTNDPRPWAFRARFVLGKFRFIGATKLPLRFYAITLFYHLGSMRT
jgi:hypothetical protein